MKEIKFIQKLSYQTYDDGELNEIAEFTLAKKLKLAEYNYKDISFIISAPVSFIYDKSVELDQILDINMNEFLYTYLIEPTSTSNIENSVLMYYDEQTETISVKYLDKVYSETDWIEFVDNNMNESVNKKRANTNSHSIIKSFNEWVKIK